MLDILAFMDDILNLVYQENFYTNNGINPQYYENGQIPMIISQPLAGGKYLDFMPSKLENSDGTLRDGGLITLNNNSNAFGLFQWLHKYGQWEELQQVASDMNTTWSDPVAQLNYWWKQANDATHTKRLQKLYSNGLQGWLQESDPYKSAYNFACCLPLDTSTQVRFASITANGLCMSS